MPFVLTLTCRMGAADSLHTQSSTFLVELREASHIMMAATNRSLVILDELGRGTSTHDGVAIAFAVLLHLVRKVRTALSPVPTPSLELETHPLDFLPFFSFSYVCLFLDWLLHALCDTLSLPQPAECHLSRADALLFYGICKGLYLFFFFFWLMSEF